MNTNLAKRRISSFLGSRFSDFKFGKRLSNFANTFLITASGKDYVVKLIEYRNFVSKINHTKRHVRGLMEVSKKINSSGHISTISVVDFVIEDKYAILLLKEERLSSLNLNDPSQLRRFGRCLAKFHSLASIVTFQKLGWNNFPTHFVRALKKHSRWHEVNSFLHKSGKLIDRNSKNVVSCHNDVHAGNIYLCTSKVIFLDIDDMCSESFFNDLGMVVANYIDPNFSKREVIKMITNLLNGYGKGGSRKNILNTAVFALRKSYFTEAYFLYANSFRHKPVAFIYKLRKRQRLLKSIVQSCL